MLIGPGLLEAGTTIWPDPSGWTLIDTWSTEKGDMGGAYSVPRPTSGIWGNGYNIDGNSFSWSPDGDSLLLTAGTADRIIQYTASTAFDPDTLSYVSTRTFGILDGPNGHSQLRGGGSFFLKNGNVYGNIKRYPATDYLVRTDFTELEIVGYDSGDASAGKLDEGDHSPAHALSYPLISAGGDRLLIMGSLSGVVYISNWTIDGGDVDAATYTNTLNIDAKPWSVDYEDNVVSQLSSDSALTAYCYGINDGKAYLITVVFDAAGALVSWTRGTAYDLSIDLTTALGFNANGVEYIWIDPDNPTYVWVCGPTTETGGMAFAKFDTGM